MLFKIAYYNQRLQCTRQYMYMKSRITVGPIQDSIVCNKAYSTHRQCPYMYLPKELMQK